MKSLPERPSLESLRKQAKKLARETGDTQRNAQLAIAREYGFAGWQDLVDEVNKRVGSLEPAVAQAEHAIHNHDAERLRKLLVDYPQLLTWRGDDGSGLLGFATGAYGDAGDEQREGWFTRADSAELLIDTGAVVAPSIAQGILQSRAKGLLELFHRKNLLPKTLEFYAALGDIDAVDKTIRETAPDLTAVSDAFVAATRFGRDTASPLLDRAIALDPTLGESIDRSVGRKAFIEHFIAARPEHATEAGLWTAFAMSKVRSAIQDRDLTTFIEGLRANQSLLGDRFVGFQNELIENATLNDCEDFLVALFELEPSILRVQPPPRSAAMEIAFTYAKTPLVPLLTRIWPVPDTLPYAAGSERLTRVNELLDTSREPQNVLDEALAFAVINRHFDVADVLIANGADVSTRWNSHEPASILHHLVFQPSPYDSMKYLIDRGINMTIHDYRWDATAQGWARYALRDETMANWLADEESRQTRRVN